MRYIPHTATTLLGACGALEFSQCVDTVPVQMFVNYYCYHYYYLIILHHLFHRLLSQTRRLPFP